MASRIILGILIMGLGLAIMKYAVWIADTFGAVGFAERYLQSPFAGTYSFYKLVGFLIILLGLGFMVGYIAFSPSA